MSGISERNRRACMVCSIVLGYSVFMREGCPNCEEVLGLQGNADAIQECTSQVFEGIIALSDPQRSWVAKWQRLQNYKPGIYATKVVGTLPDDIENDLEAAGISYVRRDGSAPEDEI